MGGTMITSENVGGDSPKPPKPGKVKPKPGKR